MSTQPAEIPGSRLPGKMWMAVCLLAAGLFLLQTGCYFAGVVVPPGKLVDADGYSRLLRVQHLADTGAWFDTTVPRSNPLVPETNQWCRWIDLVLLAGGNLFGLFLGAQKGLFAWGVLFSPLLLALCGVAMAWCPAPLLGARARLAAVVLFFVQPGVLVYLAAGRPDHHGVLLLFLILVVGCLLRAFSEGPHAARWAAAAGIFQGLALTVSIEALIACLLGLLATGFVWLLGRPGGLRVARHHILALLATSFVGVATTISWRAWTLAETDRLAPAYLLALATVALFWLAAGFLRPAVQTRGRFMLSAIGAAACLGATLSLAPTLLHHPQLSWDPRIGGLWLFSIQEYHPLADRLADWPWTVLIWMGPALVVIPWMIRTVWVERHTPGTKLPMAYLLAGCLLFTTLNLLQIRWCTYFEVYVVIPWALLLGACLQHAENRWGREGTRIPAARMAIVLGFLFGFPLLGFIGRSIATPSPAPGQAAGRAAHEMEPDLRALAAWLNGPDFQATTPETILTLLDFGPELLYRTRHNLIATPNHRNADGMLFLYDTMNAPASESRQWLDRKNITLVILCPTSHEAGFYNQENPRGTLYQDLTAGKIPDTLQKIPVPENLGEFLVFRVVR